jgi:hypothetical protein
VKKSVVLTANNLAQLSNVEQIPDSSEAVADIAGLGKRNGDENTLEDLSTNGEYQDMMRVVLYLSRDNKHRLTTLSEQAARRALDFDDTDFAWKVILYAHTVTHEE